MLRIDHEEITIFRLPQSLRRNFSYLVDDLDGEVRRVSLLVIDLEQNDDYIISL